MSDIIALGLYTAVRSCSGPAIPFKSGRIDATEAGPVGVPLPQNSLFTFQNQFARVGFNATEMIQVVACGHTLGGVHASNFPQIVPPGSAPNDVVHFDATTKFDEKIASEFVSGQIQDPLTVGPAKSVGRDSDYRVFSSDSNVTITAMADPTTYITTCKALLQRMIEVVPSGVVLTDPILPYEVKPTALQLTLLSGGTALQFAGEIRIRTTTRPANQILAVDLIYKDRTGAASSSKIPTTGIKGTAAGLDDSFTFYAFSTLLPASSSISSFIVLVTLTTGSKQIYGNNGAASGFPVQDLIMLQAPQSCLSASSGVLTVVAAVRAGSSAGPSLDLTLKVPRDGVIVPALVGKSVAMGKGATVGAYYVLYEATYTLTADQTLNTRFDVSLNGSSPRVADSFKSTADLGAGCVPLAGGGTSSSTKSVSTTSSKSTSTSTSKSSTTPSSTSKSSSSTTKSSTTSSSTSKSTSSTTKSSSTTSSKSSTTKSSTTSKSSSTLKTSTSTTSSTTTSV